MEMTPTILKPIVYKNLGNIQKRDGRVVAFDFDKILNVVQKAMHNSGEGDATDAPAVAHRVARELSRMVRETKMMPTVEGCQDEVERQLMESGFVATAKHFILYRDKRAAIREKSVQIPQHIRDLFDESAAYFKDNTMGEFVFLRTYAKWLESEGRRETWMETVQRYMDFMRENLGDKLTPPEYDEIHQSILHQEVMPSMRAMQFAGDAARRCHSCLYNCDYAVPVELRHFAEILYLSMMGCGNGWSSESMNVEQLPQIARQTGNKSDTYIIADSKEGWCDALTVGLVTWYGGDDVEFDYHLIRPAGARLKTMGGKASGPEPLRELLNFIRAKVLARQGRRLRCIDVHDAICMSGACAIAGGVRRTAMIGFSDLGDVEIRDAKKGQFWLAHDFRRVANNSAVYETRPTANQLLDEWSALIGSGTGERGIFNREAAFSTMPPRRKEYMIAKFGERLIVQLGSNPCGEIVLQPRSFCNLSEVVARLHDTWDTLLRKVRIATIIGTYQSTLTNFSYLSPEWKKNAEEERLLGVSVTGQWDCPAFSDAELTRNAMLDEATRVNVEYAERFGITPSLAITTVKPSGSVSQMLNCSSGMHPRYAPFYIRRIRIAATDSLFKLMRDQGVPYHPEVGQTADNATAFVLEFPIKSPAGARCKDEFTAIEQLEYWKSLKLGFTEHNPSVSIYVGDDEWIPVVDWVYKNWDIIGGMTFFPKDSHVYQLAPYEAITEEEYECRLATFPKIDYAKLCQYEITDETDAKREFACAGNACEM